MFESLIGCFSRRYFLWGLSSVALIYVAGKALEEFKPALVGITKEALSMGQWISSGIESKKEVLEDIVHEAKAELKKEIELKIELLQKQQELLQKLKSSI